MLQKEAWQPALLLVEICLCTSFSNPTLERLLSYLNIVKITSRNRLTNKNLSTASWIHVSGVSIGRFHKEHTSRCVDYWYNSKNLQLNQQNQKSCSKQEQQKEKQPCLDLTDVSSENNTGTDK